MKTLPQPENDRIFASGWRTWQQAHAYSDRAPPVDKPVAPPHEYFD